MLDFLRCVSLWTNMLILVVIHTSNWLLYTLTLFRYCHTQLPQLEFWTMLIGYFIAVNNNNNIIHLCVSCSFFGGWGFTLNKSIFSRGIELTIVRLPDIFNQCHNPQDYIFSCRGQWSKCSEHKRNNKWLCSSE